MAVRGDWLFLVFSSIAVVVLRPRCSAEGELFCFLPISSTVACVAGERDLVVVGLRTALGDGVLCRGFGTDRWRRCGILGGVVSSSSPS
ncbi:hypothetical protein PVAP13_5KG386907 [Panicum virgatum]|uniref:Secreted protein n=1 Tax=Panicum virgatum TaxID=38727 RepID=A0A8T0SP79_PANVG|nr:hypothetical protein PVAP13_5KG386907 [Panicum virgatum]